MFAFPSRSMQLVLFVSVIFVSSEFGGECAGADSNLAPLPKCAIARMGSLRFRHGGAITSIAFFPEGKTVVSAGHDGAVRVWDFLTGQQLRKMQCDGIAYAALSADGKKLATSASDKHTVEIWDTRTWKRVRRLPVQSGFGVAHVIAWSPKANLLAAGPFLNVWNLATNEEHHFTKGPLQNLATLREITFSPDGKGLFVASAESPRLRLLDVRSWTDIPHFKVPHSRNLFALSPSEKILAYQHRDSSIRLVNWTSGNEIRRLPGTHERISAMTFSPDGQHLATGDVKGNICLWSPTTGRRLRTITTSRGILALAFSPNGRRLAAGGWEGVVRFWEVATGGEIHSREGHDAPISALSLTPNGKVLATASHDHTIRLWNTSTAMPLKCLPGHQGIVRSVDVSPNGKLLASAADDGIIRLWSMNTGKPLRQLPGHKWKARVRFSPNGSMLAASLQLNWAYVALWDTKTWRQLSRLGRFSGPASSLAFSPDGNTLALASDAYPSFGLWDVSKHRQIKDFRNYPQPVIAMIYTPDGKSIVTAHLTKANAGLLDIATGENALQFKGHQQRGRAIQAVALSPSGKRLATAGQAGTIIIWEVATGKECLRLNGHRGPVTALQWSPDGAVLYSGSADATVLTWDTTGRRSAITAKNVRRSWDAEQVWKDLGSQDSATAYQAIRSVVANGKMSVKLLGARLRPSHPVSPQRLNKLLTELDHARFAVREKASQELMISNHSVKPDLEKALAESTSLEVRVRLKRILTHMARAEPPKELLRSLRAVEALEYVASPDARQILTRLAQGAKAAHLTREAQAALQRVVTLTARQ